MIITGLHAENVLKYGELDFADLPQEGLIAISGLNESGKSTIGETICFALFGRTYAIDHEHVQKVIRWGESRCHVSLRFRMPNGNEYEIYRYLDHDGNHSVRLNPADDPEAPIARGIEAVSQALFGLLGYDYAEFIDSFYLAQREISAPHPHSGAVRMMSGIMPLESAREQFAHEIELENSNIVEADERDIQLQESLAELAVEPGRLAAIEQRRDQLVELRDLNEKRGEELALKAEHYASLLPGMKAARRSIRRNRFWEFAFLWLGVAAGGLWWMLTQAPDHEISRTIASQLAQQPLWKAEYLPKLVYAAGGLAVLALLLWMFEAAAERRLDKLKDELRPLLEKLDELRAYRNSGEAFAELGDGAGEVEIEYPDEHRLDALRERLTSYLARAKEVREAADIENAWLDRIITAEEEAIARLDQERDIEAERLREEQSLQEEQEQCRQRIEQSSHRIRVRDLATEMLKATTERLARSFNRDMRELTAETLPVLTEDRYQHIKLDEDLGVRVFSKDKGDFVDFDEISSGTQRQVMLAVRLSMSQLLARNTVGGPQFVFLDEPFAFFDEARTRHALQMLPKLSGLPQKWIVAQDFPEGVDFDRRINCSRYELTARV